MPRPNQFDPAGLSIRNVGHVTCPPEWHWGTRVSPIIMNEPNIWLVLEGRGRLETSEGTYRLGRGDCFVFYPGLTIVGTQDLAHPLEVSYNRFRLRRTRSKNQTGLQLHRMVYDVPFLIGLLRRMQRAHFERSGCDEARTWLAGALNELARRDAEPERSGPEAGRVRTVERAAEELTRDPGGWSSVAALARKLGYSADHLTRLFKKHRGVSLQEYVLRVRLDRAAALLTTSSMGVSEIADRLGYADVHFFSRQFKKHMGRSPTEWRAAASD